MAMREEDGNIFAIPSLWPISTLSKVDNVDSQLTINDIQPLKPPCLESQALLRQRSIDRHDLQTRPPDKHALAFAPPGETEVFPTSSLFPDTESMEELSPADSHATTLAFPKLIENERTSTLVKSWTSFSDKLSHEPWGGYFSERGAAVFDAVVANQCPGGGQVIQPDALLRSLIQLNFGWESSFYSYGEKSDSFRSGIDEGRISGVTLEAFRSVRAHSVEQGIRLRRLRTSVQMHHSTERSSATMVAIAASIMPILSAMEVHLLAALTDVRSLLQVQSLFDRPLRIVTLLTYLVDTVDAIESESEVLSKLFTIFEDAEHEPHWIQQILFAILDASSLPWRTALGQSVGLGRKFSSGAQGNRPMFGASSNSPTQVDASPSNTIQCQDNLALELPAFMSSEDSRLIVDTRRNLQLLGIHEPQHPLVKTGQTMPGNTYLQWQPSWERIEKSALETQSYEQKLLSEIQIYHNSYSPVVTNGPLIFEHVSQGLSPPPTPKRQSDTRELSTWFERPLYLLATSSICSMRFEDLVPADSEEKSKVDGFAPPTQILPTLSFSPMIVTQARLVNRACLQMLRDHGLRLHFLTLLNYNLLGNGIFAARLCSALFDPTLAPAERQRGHRRIGALGLRLGYRETWPPAGSELRLALMDILSDSFCSMGPLQSMSLYRGDLPGGLSFAVRPMSEDQLQGCIDPNSITALDFLRLQYQPPSPIDAVITSASLLKYDAMFKLLLRAKRMMYVVNRLPRDIGTCRASSHSQNNIYLRFRAEMRHVVASVCSYFFECVTNTWDHLECRLAKLERALDGDCTTTDESVSRLRDFHEQLLDRMMFSLLLRKRQTGVMRVVEEIFGLVLRYAGSSRSVAMGVEKDLLTESYGLFRKKTKILVGVCRDLSEQRGEGGDDWATMCDDESTWRTRSQEGASTLGYLLLRLEMNSFYSNDDHPMG